MKFAIVSDVHGADEALARADAGADVFVCLGDLVLYLDYEDPGHGIFAELFGEEHAREYIRRRTANDYAAARELSDAAWQKLGVHTIEERRARIMERVELQYQQLFAAMPAHAYLTFGNVDVPSLWPQYLQPSHRVLDAERVEIGGMQCGFVGGGLISPMRTPFEQTPEEYLAKLEQLGPVDVLFTHIPPSLPQLTYDVVARRFEYGSEALLEYIEDVQPAFHFFGHVHQPMRSRARIGRTECVNVGHFNARRAPFVIDLDPVVLRGR